MIVLYTGLKAKKWRNKDEKGKFLVLKGLQPTENDL